MNVLHRRLRALEDNLGSNRRVVLFLKGNFPAEKREAARIEKARTEGIPPENVDLFVINTGVPDA